MEMAELKKQDECGREMRFPSYSPLSSLFSHKLNNLKMIKLSRILSVNDRPTLTTMTMNSTEKKIHCILHQFRVPKHCSSRGGSEFCGDIAAVVGESMGVLWIEGKRSRLNKRAIINEKCEQNIASRCALFRDENYSSTNCSVDFQFDLHIRSEAR